MVYATVCLRCPISPTHKAVLNNLLAESIPFFLDCLLSMRKGKNVNRNQHVPVDVRLGERRLNEKH